MHDVVQVPMCPIPARPDQARRQDKRTTKDKTAKQRQDSKTKSNRRRQVMGHETLEIVVYAFEMRRLASRQKTTIEQKREQEQEHRSTDVHEEALVLVSSCPHVPCLESQYNNKTMKNSNMKTTSNNNNNSRMSFFRG
jgi:hypothetical protein